jgi:threonine efflux protein
VHESVNLVLILSTAFAVTASPGVSSLAIAGASMHGGRRQGFAIAAGIMLGSWMWSTGAAFGLGALMIANAWVFEIMRYTGAAYLLYLAWRSGRSAWFNRPIEVAAHTWNGHVGPEILRGFLIHLTNPKVILFFASLYATGVPADASPRDLAIVVLLVGGQSMVIFIAYVVAFSSPPVVRTYTRLARPFDAALTIMFIAFASSLFFARLLGT